MIAGCLGFGLLNSALHLANGIQIFADFIAVARAEFPLEAGNIRRHPIQQAGVFSQFGGALRGAAAFPKEPFENRARVRFSRQRRSRRRPGEVVLIHACVAVVAYSDRSQQVHREFQRGHARVLADVLRGDLIDRGAEEIVRALGPLGFGRAQEGAVGGRVRAGIGVLQLHIGEHVELIFIGSQRAQRGRKFAQHASRTGRSPLRNDRSHWDVDKSQASHRDRRGRRLRCQRRDHRVEQRQSQSSPNASQECTALQSLSS